MLQELAIRNFAIIEDLRIRLGPGLTIFSGETGAGKSIIVSAFDLLLGGRAYSRLIRTGADAAELEALFAIAPESPAGRAMRRHGHDPEEGLLVRRVISRDGGNRIYVNGRLATVTVLADLTGRLAGISGQHAHQSLLREDQHLLILDRYGGLLDQRRAVAEAHAALLPLIDRRQEIEARRERRQERLELLGFQKAEIQAAGITPGEDESLEQERQRLRHAETLMQTVGGGIETLYSADGAALEQVAAVAKALERAAAVDASLAPFGERLKEITVLIEDAAADLRDYLGRLQLDEGRLEQVEERLAVLRRLKKKYGGRLEEVLAHLTAVERELEGIEGLDGELAQIRRRIGAAAETLAANCRHLSEARAAAARTLSRRVEKELASLRMGGTRFSVALTPAAVAPGGDPHLTVDGAAAGETGIDTATFMIAPNVGEDPKPLAAIASGGELSRVVLALKAILASGDALQTVVFDEVDAGIGGAVAETVGRKLSALARHHQLICITHLPQIARFGDHQFRIAKAVSDGRTRTTIEPLAAEDRIEELARMLGGETITARTLAHARELLAGGAAEEGPEGSGAQSP